MNELIEVELEDEVETIDVRQSRIDEAIFGGLTNRNEFDLAWAASAEAECRRNNRRYLAAVARNMK